MNLRFKAEVFRDPEGTQTDVKVFVNKEWVGWLSHEPGRFGVTFRPAAYVASKGQASEFPGFVPGLTKDDKMSENLHLAHPDDESLKWLALTMAKSHFEYSLNNVGNVTWKQIKEPRQANAQHARR